MMRAKLRAVVRKGGRTGGVLLGILARARGGWRKKKVAA